MAKEWGFTSAGSLYPPYINVREDGENVIVTVRGDPIAGVTGLSSSMQMTRGEFRAWANGALEHLGAA